MSLRWIALGAAGMLAAGCQSQTPDYNAAALAGLRPAQYCEASLPFFGHYRMIGARDSLNSTHSRSRILACGKPF